MAFEQDHVESFDSLQSEEAIITKEFLINDVFYEVNSENESIKNTTTHEIYLTLKPLLQHLAPNLYASYTFNPDFPDNFYILGDATRVRIIRRLQYLYDAPPVTELILQLAPLIEWIAKNTNNSQTASRSWWRALWATDGNELEATSLILYYGIFSSHNAHGKAIPNCNYHTIEETDTHIVVQTVQSRLSSRFRNVQQVGLNEQDAISRGAPEKTKEFLRKKAFQEFYSGPKNNGIWITQTQQEHQLLQKLIQTVLENPRKKLPEHEFENFDEPQTILIPKQSLEKRRYYKPSHYEDIPIEPNHIYTSKELYALGFTQQDTSRAYKKGYFIKPAHGKFQLNPEFKGGIK